MKVRNCLTVEYILGLMLVACMPFSVANADVNNTNFRRLIVETLIDSVKNREADGSSHIGRSEIQDRIVWDAPSGQRFVETYEDVRTGLRGEYRITLGMKGVADPRPPLWKLVANDISSGMRIWKRPLKEGGTLYEQALARYKKDGMVFDVFLISAARGEAVAKARSHLNTFKKKALKNNLFRPQLVSNPSFEGLWKGPMTNSKGGQANSMLKLVEARDGSITGTWHAGWKVTNVERNGNVLTWEHRNVSGCRDYKNTLTISSTLREAELTYKAYDRCNYPHTYEGEARLSRQLKN